MEVISAPAKKNRLNGFENRISLPPRSSHPIDALAFANDNVNSCGRPSDLYGAAGMPGDAFGNAAEQKTVQTAPPMRPQNDEVGMPLFSTVQNRGPRFAFADDRRGL